MDGVLCTSSASRCPPGEAVEKKRQTFAGNPPADGLLFAVNLGWELYSHRSGKTYAPWHAVKLITTGSRACKGNFWLTHNGERFARSKDAGILHECEPAVFEWAHLACVERFGK